MGKSCVSIVLGVLVNLAAGVAWPADAAVGETVLFVDDALVARQSGVVRLLAVGEEARHAVETFGAGAVWFAGVEELIAVLRAELAPGVTVLVKGSRSNRLERVAAALGAADPVRPR